MSLEWWPLLASAAFAGILMPAAMRARSDDDGPAGGVQKLHVAPTSRLGGAIIVAAFVAVALVAKIAGAAALWLSMPLVLAAVPVVLVGTMEDVVRGVRPRYRLLAAVASAAIASQIADGVVPRVDVGWVDALLAHRWIALALTWFMVAGACNAINLVDGAHGLAGGTAFIMFAGLALAAAWSGDALTLAPALAMMGAVAGFLCWNYPRGRIFLGDAGAYFIGFMYAELAIQLVARNSGISAWYVVMLAGYPIVDTLFSMYRRGVVRRMPVMAPDRLHLHTLMFRRVAVPAVRRAEDERRAGDRRRGERRQAADPSFVARFGERRRDERRGQDRRAPEASLQRANAYVAPRLWLHGVLCFALAVLWHDNTPALWAGLLAYAAVYVGRYRSLVRFARRRAPEPAGILEQTADAAKRSQ